MGPRPGPGLAWVAELAEAAGLAELVDVGLVVVELVGGSG